MFPFLSSSILHQHRKQVNFIIYVDSIYINVQLHRIRVIIYSALIREHTKVATLLIQFGCKISCYLTHRHVTRVHRCKGVYKIARKDNPIGGTMHSRLHYNEESCRDNNYCTSKTPNCRLSKYFLSRTFLHFV